MDYNQDIIAFYSSLFDFLRDKPEAIDLMLKVETLIEIKTANMLLLKQMFGYDAFNEDSVEFMANLQHEIRKQVVDEICKPAPKFDKIEFMKEVKKYRSKKSNNN